MTKFDGSKRLAKRDGVEYISCSWGYTLLMIKHINPHFLSVPVEGKRIIKK